MQAGQMAIEAVSPPSKEDHKKVADAAFNDLHRPSYHFACPEGNAFPFDPNGAIFWKGRYHLFYIFDDGGPCWGHVSSKDLIHWKKHPTALSPREQDPEKGIFSGNAFVNHEGVPTLIYHGLGLGTCIATSIDDELECWEKSPHNPVIPEATKEGDPGWGVYNVFDPHAWVEGDTTFVILGGKVKPKDEYDTTYLFQSKDLINWQYIKPFYQPNPNWTGEDEDCACPDFFKLGDRYVLMCISHACGERYYLGDYKNHKFIPQEHHRVNWPGGSCFASESLLDDQGRRVSWAWVVGQCSEGKYPHELGVMTLPRVLSIDECGKLLFDPPTELDQLRTNHRHREDFVVDEGQQLDFSEFHGDVMELRLQATIPASGQLRLLVRVSPDREELTVITVDAKQQTISVDTSQSSMNPDVYQAYPVFAPGRPHEDIRVQTAPFTLEPNEQLDLRVFLDKSILEVYANRRQYLAQRVYPTLANSLGVSLSTSQTSCAVHCLEAWEMSGIQIQ